METKDVRELVRFDDDGPTRSTLLETERLFSQVICLDRAQRLGPISDANSDAVLLVLAGRVATQIDKGRARMGQLESALVPAGSQLSLANASDEPAVILVVTAPPPAV